MIAIQIGSLKIALDYSGNQTRGIVVNDSTGEVIEGYVQDINFDEQIEKANAEAKRISLIPVVDAQPVQ